jgi:hypothetical protein
MQYARESGAGGEPAAEADASPEGARATTFAQLVCAAHTARQTLCFARAAELYERALAAGEAVLPRDSLILAHLLELASMSRCTLRVGAAHPFLGGAAAASRAAFLAAWRDDEHALALARRALELLHARWRAGTLYTLMPQELEFFAAPAPPNDASPAAAHSESGATDGPQPQIGALIYVYLTAETVLLWPLRTVAEEESCTHIIHNALTILLQMAAQGRGKLRLASDLIFATHELLTAALSSAAGGWLLRLRTTCGLPLETETRLRRLAAALHAQLARCGRLHREAIAQQRRRAATFLERHGLRRCALPACGATEPCPKAFKLCSRCRGAAYCSAAHQAEDWRRHKRDDTCAQQAA